MFTNVYICDLGWSLSEIWINNTWLVENIGVENIVLAYLHERHLFPLSPIVNRNYEVFKSLVLDRIKLIAEDMYNLLDRDIDFLKIQPSKERDMAITGLQITGRQLYLYLC